jgi:hypothetical protein
MRGPHNNPSAVNLCPGCGEDCLPTALGVAEHTARHLEWETTVAHSGMGTHFARRLVAWRAYAELLEATNRRLREDLNTFHDRIEDLEAQMDLCHREESQ